VEKSQPRRWSPERALVISIVLLLLAAGFAQFAEQQPNGSDIEELSDPIPAALAQVLATPGGARRRARCSAGTGSPTSSILHVKVKGKRVALP